jgi:hypothetical protein
MLRRYFVFGDGEELDIWRRFFDPIAASSVSSGA